MFAILETERIALREFVENDAPLLLALDSDPEVMRYIGPFGLPDEAAYRHRIRSYFQPYYAHGPDFGFWIAKEKATGQFIGWFCLRPALDYRFAMEAGFSLGEFDVGYRLVRSAWNKGFATEVTRALVDRGFTLPQVEGVVACVLASNTPSIRVLEKSGLRRVREFVLPGFDVPAAKYAITRESWFNRIHE